ncbi:MFS transporter [Parachitinimonas caeni]|uniref:MFS transporter n=1 Tax=Parachitinimonas caeni TaxID=3031301 RepID=A0ABT7DVK0_9NEIS|nr:MFS transporter [Parachitinimonas caeni]MDK2124087.1 MFS transporter [Parachitinimonas caeni]
MTRQILLSMSSRLLLATLLASLLGGLIFLVIEARQAGSPLIANSIEKNSLVIGRSLQSQLNRALNLGIPPDQLFGVEESFAHELESRHELEFIALTGSDDRQLAVIVRYERDVAAVREYLSSGQETRSQSRYRHLTLPLISGDLQLQIGFPADYIDRQVGDIMFDLAVAVLVAIVLVLECLRFFARRWRKQPLTILGSLLRSIKRGDLSRRANLSGNHSVAHIAAYFDQRQDQLRKRYEVLRHKVSLLGESGHHATDQAMARLDRLAVQYSLGYRGALAPPDATIGIRLIIFLIALSEELSRPFFAVFAGELVGPDAPLSSAAMIGIPITAFMLVWALSQPLGPMLAQRVGLRKGMLLSGLLAGGCLALTGFAQRWEVLAVLRGLTGLGYGLMLIFGQAAVIRATSLETRARGLAEVAAAVVAAGVCGPMLGGAIADKFGYEAAFVACALCAISAAMLTLRVLPPQLSQTELSSPPGLRTILKYLKDRKFGGLIVFSAVPTKFAATAILVVLAPLAMADAGASKAATGRMILLYFLSFMLVAGWAARMSDRMGRRKPFLLLGGIGSALGCIAAVMIDGQLGIALCCALLGASQACISAPQLALVTSLVRRDRDRSEAEMGLGVFRLLERIGSVLAPFAAALLATRFSRMEAIGAIGAILFVCAILTSLALIRHREGRQA